MPRSLDASPVQLLARLTPGVKIEAGAEGTLVASFDEKSAPLGAFGAHAVESAPLLAQGEDDKFQGEVMRLAPAAKADPRKPQQGEAT